MNGYQEHRYWSPIHGDWVSRITVFDAQGMEFFQTIPGKSGKEYREKRAEAAQAILAAIKRGDQPGEVLETD